MVLTNRPKETQQYRDAEARRACERARELERAGDYEGARAALGKLWTRIGERPVVDELSRETRAETLLRVGSLSGWPESARQIPGAYEFARDLLTESITLFESLNLSDKRAEATTNLALCYWRLGAQDDGRAAEALTHLDKARAIFVSLKDSGSAAQVDETRARVLLAEKRFAEAERVILNAITILEQGDDASRLAQALTTEGSIFARGGKYDSARKSFQRASEVSATGGESHLAAMAQLRMIEELGTVLSRAELTAAYRRADRYVGDHASQLDLQRLRECFRIVIASW